MNKATHARLSKYVHALQKGGVLTVVEFKTLRTKLEKMREPEKKQCLLCNRVIILRSNGTFPQHLKRKPRKGSKTIFKIPSCPGGQWPYDRTK